MSTLYAAKVVNPVKKVKAKTVAHDPELPPPAKKPRTEKQIAAFEKAKATKAKNAEEKRRKEEEEIVAKKTELEEANKKLFEAEAKKQAANEKRRQARLAKKMVDQVAKEVEEGYDADSDEGDNDEDMDSNDVTVSQELEEALAAEELLVAEKPKKKQPAQRKKIEIQPAEKQQESSSEEETVPKWFEKLIENAKQQENSLETTGKKSQKVVKQEAKDIAQERWSQPQVRQQVHKQVDDHMDRMYKQIFFGRR
jgi:hypothetical protein